MKEPVQTQLTDIAPNRIIIRGYDVVDLAGRCSFGDLVYLLARGELPPGREGELLEAILVCCADHGINAPSTQVARSVASCGAPLQAAIAAGVSALGDWHGGAGEALAEAMHTALASNPDIEAAAEAVIESFTSADMRVPGFGHRVHNPDPRAICLFELAEHWEVAGRYTELARTVERRLETWRGRPLPINVDGALAALVLDIGLDWHFARGIFIIARCAGLAAHVNEELLTGNPMGFPTPQPVTYTGPVARNLPD
jgi:citrate synthase